MALNIKDLQDLPFLSHSIWSVHFTLMFIGITNYEIRQFLLLPLVRLHISEANHTWTIHKLFAPCDYPACANGGALLVDADKNPMRRPVLLIFYNDDICENRMRLYW